MLLSMLVACCLSGTELIATRWHAFGLDTNIPHTWDLGYFPARRSLDLAVVIGDNTLIDDKGIFPVIDHDLHAFLNVARNRSLDLIYSCVDSMNCEFTTEDRFYNTTTDLWPFTVTAVRINVASYAGNRMIARYEFLPEPSMMCLFLVGMVFARQRCLLTKHG